jgi:hypothetical protein
MGRIRAYFLLLLIVGVQFGSTGFTYYVNQCSASGNTSMTFSYVGCRCSHSSPNTEEGSEETILKMKCCTSTEFFIDTADDFPNASNSLVTTFSFEFLLERPYVEFHGSNSKKLTLGKHANPPPWQDYNRLIFIQSFLI